jgi:hypothetical protein
MTVEALIDTLTDLLKACRKAKSQKLELGTIQSSQGTGKTEY